MNGITLYDSDHYEAVDVLKGSGNNITMVVGREVIVEREPDDDQEEGEEEEVNAELLFLFVSVHTSVLNYYYYKFIFNSRIVSF